MSSQYSKTISNSGIIGGEQSAIAGTTKVLRREEAKTAYGAYTSDRLTVVFGADRLGGVLHNG
jgi:hypothetical protein